METAHKLETPLTNPSNIGLVKLCAAQTLDALVARQHLQAEERDHVEQMHYDAVDDGEAAEVFETITRLSTVAPREIPDFMVKLGNAVSKTINLHIPLLPNAVKFNPPAAFYDAFPEIYDLARDLLSPILFSEDNEVLGVASINPIPAIRLGKETVDRLSKPLGFSPFITVVRLDYGSWHKLLEKHFGL